MLEEDILRFGAAEKRRVSPTLEALQTQVTLLHALTAASVQGDTVEGAVCLADLDNPHMRTKAMLEMACGRARTAASPCFR